MNVLDEALEILRTNGWTKGRYKRGEGQYCLQGVIIRDYVNDYGFVSKYPFDLELAQICVSTEICRQFGDRINSLSSSTDRSIVGFNDHADTTFSDIEQVLEKAALRLEGVRTWMPPRSSDSQRPLTNTLEESKPLVSEPNET